MRGRGFIHATPASSRLLTQTSKVKCAKKLSANSCKLHCKMEFSSALLTTRAARSRECYKASGSTKWTFGSRLAESFAEPATRFFLYLLFVPDLLSGARHDRFHGIAEPIDLRRRGVNVRADANSIEEGRVDRCNENVVLAEQRIAELSRFDGVEVNRRERARLLWIQAHQHFGSRHLA